MNMVDPNMINLEGVSPLRWSLEDVATPYEGPLDDAYDCHKKRADGYQDLVLKFMAEELTTALRNVKDGDVLVLVLTGKLKSEFGGTTISGEDVVRILSKKSQGPAIFYR